MVDEVVSNPDQGPDSCHLDSATLPVMSWPIAERAERLRSITTSVPEYAVLEARLLASRLSIGSHASCTAPRFDLAE